MRQGIRALVVTLLAMLAAACQGPDRVDQLLSQMTLEEKCGQLCCPIGFGFYGKDADSLWLADDFLGRMDTMPLGSCWAVLRSDPWSQKTVETGLHPRESAQMLNMMQRHAIEHTRLGIPLLFCEETPHGHMAVGTTVFPTGIGQASTWDPQLLEQMGEVMGLELRLQGAQVGYGPVLDIARDPRWSRVEETMGEDPYLSGVLGAAVVSGMQRHVVATLKHLAAYGVPQGGHNAANAEVGPNRLTHDYLPAFQRAIQEGHAGAVMTAYNSIDGVPCTANRWLLEEVLRQSWDFHGVVFADLNAINALYATQHVAADPAEAAALALKAGVDIDLGGYNYGGFLKTALRRGLVTEDDIDRAVRHVLQLKYDLGLFDHPYVDEDEAERGVGTAEHRAVARQVALESAVLLKNDGLLPFSTEIKKVAVVGPNADNVYAQLGDYTAPQDPERVVTLLEGIREQGRAVVTDDLRAADAIVLVVGGSSARDFKTSYEDTGAAIVESHSDMDCGEGYDRSSLRLLGGQEALMQEVYALGKPVVTVYVCGRPMDMNLAAERSNALLLLWYPGMEGGTALAEILWGEYNPSGKLPISIPRSVGQIPVYYSMPTTGDYVEESAKPLYPFGYGLSYTDFEYGEMVVDGDQVSVTVTNVGDREGVEVVQLYATPKRPALALWSKQLVAFQRIRLLPGASQQVVFPVADSTASYTFRID